MRRRGKPGARAQAQRTISRVSQPMPICLGCIDRRCRYRYGVLGIVCECPCHQRRPRSLVVHLQHPRFYLAWDALTRNPAISRRRLAVAIGLRSSFAGQYWVEQLEMAGFIRRSDEDAGPVYVLLPFRLVTRDPARPRELPGRHQPKRIERR